MQPEWKKVGVFFKILTDTSIGKRLLGRPGRSWKDNIKMDIKEVGVSAWSCLLRLRIGIFGEPFNFPRFMNFLLQFYNLFPREQVNGTNYEVPHCGAFSTPHSHPNIYLRIQFSNTLSLHSSLNVRDHASQPYSTTDNIIVLYILIFIFLERSREDKSVWTE